MQRLGQREPSVSRARAGQAGPDEVHLWRVELDATSPQPAEDMRVIDCSQ
jgi:hypothetical protein